MIERTGKNKRFGIIAVEKGYVCQHHIAAALATQVSDNLGLGVHRKIGAILFDCGLLTCSQIRDVLTNIAMATKSDPKNDDRC